MVENYIFNEFKMKGVLFFYSSKEILENVQHPTFSTDQTSVRHLRYVIMGTRKDEAKKK